MELLQGKTGIQIQACQAPNHYPKLCVPPDVASFLPAEQKTALPNAVKANRRNVNPPELPENKMACFGRNTAVGVCSVPQQDVERGCRNGT